MYRYRTSFYVCMSLSCTLVGVMKLNQFTSLHPWTEKLLVVITSELLVKCTHSMIVPRPGLIAAAEIIVPVMPMTEAASS